MKQACPRCKHPITLKATAKGIATGVCLNCGYKVAERVLQTKAPA